MNQLKKIFVGFFLIFMLVSGQSVFASNLYIPTNPTTAPEGGVPLTNLQNQVIGNIEGGPGETWYVFTNNTERTLTQIKVELFAATNYNFAVYTWDSYYGFYHDVRSAHADGYEWEVVALGKKLRPGSKIFVQVYSHTVNDYNGQYELTFNIK